ncbi:MAG: phage portal protein [Fusobacterium gastrosuis]|uniref:phage tail assembly chaperone n=1 Tax=Fusobacterium gastrosuis TaxID=1755100 RepID=UPI002A8B4374|nr:phage portal protein [Fusobacterium gastrosuis]
MAKNITLDILLTRKQQSENDKLKVVLFDSEILGGTIEIHKQKARDVIKIMDSAKDRTMEESTNANCKIILKHCPIFREKELQAAYGVAEPQEVILKVFDENLGEIGKLTSKILELYGLAESQENTNKLAEEEVEELKN